MNATFNTLKQMGIRATASGLVAGLMAHTVGGVIQPGETVLEIVPDNDDLIIEAKVQPMEINNVQLGLESDVHFTAFSQHTTPKLTEQVVYISADSLTEPNKDVPFSLVRITAPKEEVARLGNNYLLPGMPFDVLIKTGERTPLTISSNPSPTA